jgi:hypothetical protein
MRVISRLLPRKLELGDGPGGGHAEDQVQRHGDGRGEQGQPDGCQRVGLDQGLADRRPTLCAAPPRTRAQRHEQHQAEEEQGDADQQPAHPGRDPDGRARRRPCRPWEARGRGEMSRDGWASGCGVGRMVRSCRGRPRLPSSRPTPNRPFLTHRFALHACSRLMRAAGQTR